MRDAAGPRGRFAPSPTGEVHLGNASTALLAWLSIRARHGTVIMRMEDLDRGRVRDGLAEKILRDMAWLGLDWDEGPDAGGSRGPYEQSRRIELYEEAFRRLGGQGRLFACFCSRKDVAAAASAPQEPGDAARYPGTCRCLDPRTARKRIENGDRHAWRFRVEPGDRPRFDDLVRGARDGDRGEAPGDFVVWRSDGVPAYQLAVVVDDASMDVTEVVRGEDLLASTSQQLLLYRVLGHPPPRFGHVPLLVDTDGVRLSKRQHGVTLRELREAGFAPERIVGRLAWLFGLRPDPSPVAASDLIDGFSLSRLATAPATVRVDIETWSR